MYAKYLDMFYCYCTVMPVFMFIVVFILLHFGTFNLKCVLEEWCITEWLVYDVVYHWPKFHDTRCICSACVLLTKRILIKLMIQLPFFGMAQTLATCYKVFVITDLVIIRNHILPPLKLHLITVVRCLCNKRLRCSPLTKTERSYKKNFTH